jgi:hypothetical protein
MHSLVLFYWKTNHESKENGEPRLSREKLEWSIPNANYEYSRAAFWKPTIMAYLPVPS